MSVIDRAALVALLEDKVKSSASPKVTAADVREVLNACVESLVALIDDKDVAGGYLGIDSITEKADNTFLDLLFVPLFVLYVDSPNVGSTETDLVNNNILGDRLINNGDQLECEYAGSIKSTGTDTRRFRLYFGGALIYDSSAFAVTADTTFNFKVTIMRESPTTLRTSGILSIQKSTATQNFINLIKTTALDFTLDYALVLTGQSAGASPANSDIVLSLSKVNYIKSPQ